MPDLEGKAPDQKTIRNSPGGASRQLHLVVVKKSGDEFEIDRFLRHSSRKKRLTLLEDTIY